MEHQTQSWTPVGPRAFGWSRVLDAGLPLAKWSGQEASQSAIPTRLSCITLGPCGRSALRPNGTGWKSVPRRVKRCARRNTPPLFARSTFCLDDQHSCSSPFIRSIFRGNGKAAGPHNISAARQHRPAVALPAADMLLIQQSLQLVRASVTYRL